MRKALKWVLEIQTHAQLGDPDALVNADEMARRLQKLDEEIGDEEGIGMADGVELQQSMFRCLRILEGEDERG